MFHEISSVSQQHVSHAFSCPVYSATGNFTAGDAEPFTPVCDEQALWRAVIVQALMDAACGSEKHEAVKARDEALIWLRGTSEDFATVCYYAGYEPEFVRMLVKKALEKNCQWRALPGEGTRIRHTRQRSTQKAKQRR